MVRTLRLGAAILALGGSGQAWAQEQGGPRERTGPLAAPLPAPGYAAPAAPAVPLVDAGPPIDAGPQVSPPPGPAVTLLDVRIETEGSGVAMPAPGWRPAIDQDMALRLAHEPGEAFDAAWVRRQFEGNGMIGQPADYSRVVTLVQLINRAFLQNGYANSGVLVAPQPLEQAGGVLALRLVAGRIGEAPGDLTVQWRDNARGGLSARYILDRLPSARATPFNAFALESDFRLLADDPAIRTIDARLRPGSRPGAAELALNVDPQRRIDLHAVVANNRSPAVGGIRAAIGGSLRNMLTGGDMISGEAGITDGLKDASLGYSGPLLGPRTTIELRGGINDAAVVERLLLPLDIRSKEWTAEGGIAHKLIDNPLIPKGAAWSSAKSLAIGLLVVHRQTKTRLLGAPFSFSPGAVNGRAEYTALRLTQDYVARGVDQVLALSLTETIGIEGTRSPLPGALNPSKNFTAILAQASYARRLTRQIELNLRLAGQYSGGTLYSGERFSIGGSHGVRGYRENLLLADRGLLGTVELGYTFSLTGGGKGERGFDWGAFRIGVFADGALAENARSPQPLPKSLASVGASLTWKPSEALNARVTYGEALRDPFITGKRHLQDKGFQFHVTFRPLRF